MRSLAFNLSFYLLTTVMALVGLPALATQRSALAYARIWARLTLWLLRTLAGTHVEFRGLENLPKGAVLIGAKHQSALETLALCTVLPRFAYILKRELLWIPLIGWYLSRTGMVAIDRAKAGRAMSAMNAAAAEAIGEGCQLIIFPEGTRRPPGAEPAYKQGLSHLYAALAVPCVPVALNTGLYWPRRRFVRRPGTAVIEFLAPIPPGMPRAEFLDLAQARIEAASDALLAAGRAALAADGQTAAELSPDAGTSRPA